MDIFISDTVKESIADAAKKAQQYLEQQYGTHYEVNDLEKALVHWLEVSIEQLADDSCYHCVDGDLSLVFNRCVFTSALSKVQPAYSPAEADGVAV